METNEAKNGGERKKYVQKSEAQELIDTHRPIT